MTTPQDDAGNTGRRQQPGRWFDEVDVQRASQQKSPPVTGGQHTASQFKLSATGQQNAMPQPGLPYETGRQSSVSQFKIPATTGRQNAAPQFKPLATGKQSVMPQPTTDPQNTAWRHHVPVTGNQNAISGYQRAITDEQEAIRTEYQKAVTGWYKAYTSSWESVPAVSKEANLSRKRKKEKSNLPFLEEKTPLIAFLLNVAFVALVVWMDTMGGLIGLTSSLWPGSLKPSLNDITNNTTISPLLFGTNIAQFHDWDEAVLKSQKTRQMLKDIGVRVIRMPTRDTLKPESEIAAANAVKAIGAVPLVIVSGPEYKGSDILDSDMTILSRYTKVFGNEPVYFEFGNESDLNGINMDQYVATWNAVVPTLKMSFPTAKFIGPDNFQFSRRFLKNFLQKAKPRPDGISWHEYACSVNWSAQFCLDNINNWPVHFAQARAVMQEAIKTELPIWITEWNYAPDQAFLGGVPIKDGKWNNPAFMQAWTTKAMDALVAGRIYAAMQYYSTNAAMPLISSDGKLETEGKIFQQNYQRIMVKGYTPPASPDKPPVPKPLPATVRPQYSFEKGTDGWDSNGATGSSRTKVTTLKAFEGKSALQVTLTNQSEDAQPTITVTPQYPLTPPKAGQMIHAYVYVANAKALVNAKLFVSNGTVGVNSWYFANDITLTPGMWNHIWYALPENFTDKANQIGIQFYTATPGVKSDVYIDAVYW